LRYIINGKNVINPIGLENMKRKGKPIQVIVLPNAAVKKMLPRIAPIKLGKV
jgi:hypothetical protein